MHSESASCAGIQRQGVCGPSMTNSGLPPQPPRDNSRARTHKYTWSQLNQFVRANHHNYSGIHLRVPSTFTFADTSPSSSSPSSSIATHHLCIPPDCGQGDCSMPPLHESTLPAGDENAGLSSAADQRIYFLGHNDTSREQTIQFIDLPSLNIKDWSKLPQYPQSKSLLGPWIDGTAHSCRSSPKTKAFSSLSTKYSHQPREEQLIRERKRLPSIGITQFEADPNCETIVFLNSKALYHCKPRAKERLSPTLNSLTRPSNAPSYPSVCPSNPDLLAFISQRDIFVLHTKFPTVLETRLTFTHKPAESPQVFSFINNNNEDSSSTPESVGSSTDASQGGVSLSAGVPSFVAQEEFDRFMGYWWQPTSTNFVAEDASHCGLYRIIYEEVDESRVDVINIQNPLSDKCDSYRYPKAGSFNAKSSLRLLTFSVNHNSGAISLISNCALPPNELEGCVPNAEYLTRAGWCPSGDFFWSQWLSRDQQHLYIVLTSVSSFCSSFSYPLVSLIFPTAGKQSLSSQEDYRSQTILQKILEASNATPKIVQKIFEESTDVWINVHDIMHVVASETNHEKISFIFASQQTKFRHLYFVQTKLASENSLGHEDTQCLAVPLTSGPWEVIGKNVWVDERRKVVYFVGLKDSELEAHLYVCSYKHPNLGVFRLTQLGFYHSVHVNSHCTMFIDSYSNLNTPPALTLHRLSAGDEEKEDLEVRSVTWFEQLCDSVQSPPNHYRLLSPQYPQEMHVPESFSFPSSDSAYLLHGLLYKPDNFQPGVKYPCLLYVYAGPQVQIVNNSFKGHQFLRLHSLLTIGFVVVIIDGRGSANRGLQFEGSIKNALGSVEIQDQLQGLNFIADKSGCIDLSRVAVHGWSYGGYISLLALAQNPCKFMCAAAAAPVVNWREYDTGYTERYLGMPESNMAAYGTSSVLNYIQHFPSEANRLLIIHGAIDENVHYRHTAMLINSLIMNCKPFLQITYPMERHGLRNTEASEHFETSLLHFFNSNA